MGGKAEYPFRFLEGWKNPEKVVSWLKQLDWNKGVWVSGNLAMFLGICLIKDYEVTREKKTGDALEAFLKWHDEFQDPKTGFWGTNCGAPMHNAMFGAMHQFLLYYYLDRPIKYVDKIVDKTVTIQQSDGIFSPKGGGGGCEDLDAVDILVNMYGRMNYRRNDIKETLRKTINPIILTQGEDGGFLWARNINSVSAKYLQVLTSIERIKDVNCWSYMTMEAVYGQLRGNKKPRTPKGWTQTAIPTLESDIFSTWFRSLSLALVSKVLPENPYAKIEWKFLKSPGLGYYNERLSH